MNFSTLKIYGTIPFQKDYKHTIDFESKSEQKKYFSTEFNKKGKSFSDFLYIDEYQKIIVEGAKGKFDGYNYLSFVNGDSNRTFYCFIDRFEYVSEDSTAIYFTVDVMQTYMFDYTLGQSLIERCHVDRWTLGDAHIPLFNNICYAENLEISDYDIIKQYEKSYDFCFVAVILSDGVQFTSGEGVYPFRLDRPYFIFPVPNGINAPLRIKINGKDTYSLEKLSQSNFTNKILSIGVLHDIGVPYNYEKISINEANITLNSKYVTAIDDNINVIRDGVSEMSKSYPNILKLPSITNEELNQNLDFNIKYESKLAISPYTRYFLTDNINSTHEYLIRNIADTKISLNYNHIIGNDITESITIKNYKNMNNSKINIDFNIDGNRYIPVTQNTWNNYMNTMAIKDFINIFTSAGLGSIGGISNGLGNIISTALLPNTTENNKSYFANLMKFYGNKLILYKEEAINKFNIGNYFNAYGYSYPVYGSIDKKSRYWFNYIKTKICNIYSSYLTNEIINNIKEIYNNGITFWHYNNGNYIWQSYYKNNIERSLLK